MTTLAPSPGTKAGAVRRAEHRAPSLKAARHGNRSAASVIFLVALAVAAVAVAAIVIARLNSQASKIPE